MTKEVSPTFTLPIPLMLWLRVSISFLWSSERAKGYESNMKPSRNYGGHRKREARGAGARGCKTDEQLFVDAECHQKLLPLLILSVLACASG